MGEMLELLASLPNDSVGAPWCGVGSGLPTKLIRGAFAHVAAAQCGRARRLVTSRGPLYDYRKPRQPRFVGSLTAPRPPASGGWSGTISRCWSSMIARCMSRITLPSYGAATPVLPFHVRSATLDSVRATVKRSLLTFRMSSGNGHTLSACADQRRSVRPAPPSRTRGLLRRRVIAGRE
jgi:hypothetical protein